MKTHIKWVPREKRALSCIYIECCCFCSCCFISAWTVSLSHSTSATKLVNHRFNASMQIPISLQLCRFWSLITALHVYINLMNQTKGRWQLIMFKQTPERDTHMFILSCHITQHKSVQHEIWINNNFNKRASFL